MPRDNDNEHLERTKNELENTDRADTPIVRTLALLQSGKAIIGIVGMGYVGLPLALACARKFNVVGYDSDDSKRAKLKSGQSYIDDVLSGDLESALDSRFEIADNVQQLKKCDCIVICVPTPLDSHGIPDLSMLKQSADALQSVLREGMLVVLESTSYPGTTEEYLGRAIASAGLVPGREVALAFSPERIDPGNRDFDVMNTPKVIGGIDSGSTELAAALYSAVIEADVVEVKDCATAEAVKMLENIFRGVNIALINEMALVFERMGIDTWDVVRAASTKPFGFMPHYPGPGVGGHCIPLDPLYMSYRAKQFGFIPRFIELSREVNEFMKIHTVNLTIAALGMSGLAPRDSTVAVMGLSYKKGISDTRESPSITIIEELSKRVGVVLVHDPYVESMRTSLGLHKCSDISEIISRADCLLFVVDHKEYGALISRFAEGTRLRAIVDTRNIFEREMIERMGYLYLGLGK